MMIKGTGTVIEHLSIDEKIYYTWIIDTDIGVKVSGYKHYMKRGFAERAMRKGAEGINIEISDILNCKYGPF